MSLIKCFMKMIAFNSLIMGFCCYGMDQKTQALEKDDQADRLRVFYEKMEDLNLIKELDLNVEVSGPILITIYKKLLLWISQGNSFFYSAFTDESARKRAIFVLNRTRDEWLAANSGKMLPELSSHFRKSTSDSDVGCHENCGMCSLNNW